MKKMLSRLLMKLRKKTTQKFTGHPHYRLLD